MLNIYQVIRSNLHNLVRFRLDHQEYSQFVALEWLVSPVLECIVFILVLDDQPLAGEVVGLTLPPPPELDLHKIVQLANIST